VQNAVGGRIQFELKFSRRAPGLIHQRGIE
jgi:hypothetical protein